MCVQPGDRAPTAGTQRLYTGGVVLELCVGPPLRADVQYVDSSYVFCHVNVIYQNLCMFTARGYVCTSIFGLILTEKHYPEGWGLDQPTNVRTSQPTRGDVTSFLSAVHRQGHPQPVLPPPYSHCVDPPPPYESIYQQFRADSYPGS